MAANAARCRILSDLSALGGLYDTQLLQNGDSIQRSIVLVAHNLQTDTLVRVARIG